MDTLFQKELSREFNLPEPEEIEAAEDEKRRNDELKDMLQNAFDDLEDDSRTVENSYYDSSQGCDSNFRQLSKDHRNPQNETPANIPNHSSRYSSPGYDNYQQLQVLYQVRLREIDKLHADMESFKETTNQEKSQLLEKIIALEAEKQNVAISNQESQKKLVENKRRLLGYENEMKELQQKLHETDSQKNKALHELEMIKLSNREMEQRLLVLEKNSYKNEEKNFDNYLKDINSKHKRQVADLEKQINSLSNRLMAKENDCLKLEHQLLDLQRIHESTLVEKTEIINKLTANLEQSQSQCHKLISNSNNHDTVQLLNQIKSQKNELNSFSIQISALKKEKNQLIEQLQKLRSEKNNDNKSYQDQIHKLQTKIRQLVEENETSKESASKNESSNTSDKKDDFLKIIEESITSDMKEKIVKLELDLEENLKECDNVKKLYIEVCAEKDSLSKQNSSLEKALNDLKNEECRLNESIRIISTEKQELTRALESLKTEFNCQKHELEEMKTAHEEELRKNSEKHIREMDDFKLALKNEFSKIEVFHQDQLGKLEVECAKKILQIENTHKTQIQQIEAKVKEEAVRICSEEIKNLTDSYKTELRNLQTKHDAAIEELNEKLKQVLQQHVNLRSEFSEVYNKYKKARKVATSLKETLDQRNQLMRERNSQFMIVINEIQNHLNYALDFKFTDTESAKTEQFDLLKNDLGPSTEEFETVINSINQKLTYLKNKTIPQPNQVNQINS